MDANRIAHSLAQLSHESEFKLTEENLNYSADGLIKTFSTYFNPSLAKLYARKPQAIANRVYANRLGNGNEASEDGWRYRGRGYAQLTGKDNYARFGKLIGVDLVGNPDLLLEVGISAQVAAAFLSTCLKGGPLAAYMDRGGIEAVAPITKVYNGGRNGLGSRMSKYKVAAQFLGVSKPPLFFWPVPIGSGADEYNMDVGQYCDPAYYAVIGSVHPAQDFNINRLKGESSDKDYGKPHGAFCDGKVFSVEPHRVWGNITLISHIDPITLEPFWTQQSHSKEVLVRPGEWVRGGQVIGTIGKGGNEAMPAHLHFEYRVFGPDLLSDDFWPSLKYPVRAEAEACVRRNYRDPRAEALARGAVNPTLISPGLRRKVTT